MNLDEAWKHAQRYVFEAHWHEGSQGNSGWYDVQLNCGHRMKCSSSHLSAAMLCLECFKEKAA